jgi:hypothetical protein
MLTVTRFRNVADINVCVHFVFTFFFSSLSLQEEDGIFLTSLCHINIYIYEIWWIILQDECVEILEGCYSVISDSGFLILYELITDWGGGGRYVWFSASLHILNRVFRGTCSIFVRDTSHVWEIQIVVDFTCEFVAHCSRKRRGWSELIPGSISLIASS